MWTKLKEKHPIAYECIQWSVTLMALAALIKSFLN
jgi:hypothetical protein